MERERAKTRLFLRYFAPFGLLVFLIAALSSVWLYRQTRIQARAEIDAQLTNNVESAADFFETQFLEMDRIVYNLTQKSAMRPYTLFLNKYVHTEIGTEISSYVSANSYLDDVMLYYGDHIASRYGEKAVILNKVGVREARTNWQYRYRFENLEYDEFTSLAGSLDTSVVFPVLKNRNISNMANSHMAYIVPNGEDSAIIFLVNLKRLQAYFAAELSHYDGSLRIYSGEGKEILTLSYSDGECAPFDTAVEYPSGRAIIRSLPGGSARAVIVAAPRNWTYVVDWNENPFMKLYTSVVSVQIPFLALVLFGGILIAIWVSRFAFRPIAKVYDSVAAYARKPLVVSFDGMVESLREMEGHWDALKYQMEQQRELCHLQVIDGILKGRYREDRQIERLLSENEIDLAGETYFVYAVHVLARDKNRDSTLPQALPRYLEECGCAEGEKRSALLMDEYDVYALICSLPGDQTPAGHSDAFFQSLREGMEATALVTVGVGDATDSLAGIAGAYAEALSALQFEFLLGHDRLIRIGDVRETTEREIVWYPVQIEELLSRALAVGDEAVVLEQIHSLSELLRGMRAPYGVARSILSSMIRRMADNCREADNAHAEAELIRVEHLLGNRSFTMDDVLAQVRSVMTTACQKAVSMRPADQEALASRVDVYLRASLSRESLSLPEIADAFFMSAGYLSRLYKQQTGSTIMRALDDMRIDAACALVRDTDLVLADILARCGYSDKGNFIRKFKKRFGVTPMRYREMYRSPGENAEL